MRRTAVRYSIDDLIGDSMSPYNQFGFGGSQYLAGPAVNTTMAGQKAEQIGNNFEGYARTGLMSNAVVFAVSMARLRLFTEARFQWQRLNGGVPGDLFGTNDLAILETPWVNGTTGQLLAGMEQHATLAGNSFTARRGDQLRRMRPDWTGIVLGSPSGDPEDLDAEPVGYIYWPGGPAKNPPITLLPSDVAHFAPIPDPLHPHRGMSWLTPIIREIQADGAATQHKLAFFENAATPNLVYKLSDKLTPAQFKEFVQLSKDGHEGARNAYRSLYIGGGADVSVVGADMKQLDFKITQGAGETRIAAVAGVPPIIASLSEGLDAATYSNYGQARRHFGDIFARPQWREAAAALASILPPQQGARLWYDDRGISFLQEDQKDAADILQADAITMKQLIEAGYEPDTVTKAVKARDMSLLVHTGLVSVQLQNPKQGAAPAGSTPAAEPTLPAA
jgi:phage portal protein BeeE